ncbi:MAG: hypothetical protein C3F06_10795 [Candidatus Methanoperedenaceae archaeon]|nr:MAG: hypothetical protein C3F06_10795 [Candidatus Methanoperedenaceae archaeon]
MRKHFSPYPPKRLTFFASSAIFWDGNIMNLFLEKVEGNVNIRMFPGMDFSHKVLICIKDKVS